MTILLRAAGDNGSDTASWIAALAAVVAIGLSVIALIVSGKATSHSGRSATAAEKSENHAKRSADAAESSASTAADASDAAQRSAEADQIQAEIARRVRWDPKREGDLHRLEIINLGGENAHDVELNGPAVEGGVKTRPLVRVGESIKFRYSIGYDEERFITVSWLRPVDHGQERQTWIHELWHPDAPEPRILVM